jgi:hypothetical protein
MEFSCCVFVYDPEVRQLRGLTLRVFLDGRRRFWTAGKDIAFVQKIRIARESADDNASFGDTQLAGSHIPGVQVFHEEAIVATASHVNKVRRGGAWLAQATTFLGH